MFKTLWLGFSRNTILVFLVIINSLFHLTPLLYENFKIIIIAVWLLTIFYFIFTNKKRASIDLKKMQTFGAFYIIIGLLYSFMEISSGKIMRDMLFSLFVFPMMLLVLMDSRVTKYNVRLLFHIIAIIGAANIIENIRLSILYPGIALMTEETLEEYGLTGLNVGGAPFVAMATFYLTISMMAFLYAKDKIDKLLFLIYVAIALTFVIFFSYKTSNVIYSILIVGMLLIVNKIRHPAKAVAALGICAGLLLLFIDPLIHALIGLIDNSRVASRLLVFAESDNVYANANSINSRMELWGVSIKTWLDSPVNFIFGIGEHSRKDYISTEASGIGNHSDFFDILARYGIIGGLILFNILKYLFLYAKKLGTGKLYLKILVFFVLIIMFGFTKKIILPSISIMMFVFFPLCLYYIKGNERHRKQG